MELFGEHGRPTGLDAHILPPSHAMLQTMGTEPTQSTLGPSTRIIRPWLFTLLTMLAAFTAMHCFPSIGSTACICLGAGLLLGLIVPRPGQQDLTPSDDARYESPSWSSPAQQLVYMPPMGGTGRLPRH